MKTAQIALAMAAVCAPLHVFAEDRVQPANMEGDAAARDKHYGSYEAPAIDTIEIKGKRPLHEEDLIGSYKQPRWTAERRFPTTRVYVIPEGKFAVEYWLRATTDLGEFSKASAKEYRSIYELEWGLGHRLQLDLYLVTEQGGHGAIEIHKEQVELRYALADYGEIWGNPTLYLEYSRVGGESSAVEAKLLLGGELTQGLHGAVNLVFEPQISEPREHEYKIAAGIAKTIVDSKFSFGGELELEAHDAKDARFDFTETQVLVGPSVQWKPSPAINILVTPQFGLTMPKDEDSIAVYRQWLVFGWEY